MKYLILAALVLTGCDTATVKSCSDHLESATNYGWAALTAKQQAQLAIAYGRGTERALIRKRDSLWVLRVKTYIKYGACSGIDSATSVAAAGGWSY